MIKVALEITSTDPRLDEGLPHIVDVLRKAAVAAADAGYRVSFTADGKAIE